MVRVLGQIFGSDARESYNRIYRLRSTDQGGNTDDFGAAIQVDPANAPLAAHSVSGLTLKRHC